ncbi:hypothetical protein DVH24_036056 [Malus domestica]|uniref:Autophagy-related protein n=1 Tax=Malus domestica TaxID=3750 RepID=A0A498KV11_MALDO|nr:hypothetical protein DVH24_036056 [Malus domestica]
MGRTKTFKDEFKFDQRIEESRDMVTKYPDRVPVIVEKYARSNLPQMEKKRLKVVLVTSIQTSPGPGTALFVFVKDTMPQTASLMDSVYESFKDVDGFLYLCYSTEKPLAFGINEMMMPIFTQDLEQ